MIVGPGAGREVEAMLTCWSGTSLDTQPRVDRAAASPDRVDVTLTVGLWTDEPPQPGGRLEAGWYDDASGAWVPVAPPDPERLTSPAVEARLKAEDAEDEVLWLEDACRLQDLRVAWWRSPANRYLRYPLRDLPAGSLLRYRAVPSLGDVEQPAAASPWRRVWLVAADFGPADLRCAHTDEDHGGVLADEHWWVHLARKETYADRPAWEFHHLRFDLLSGHAPDDEAALPVFRIAIGDGPAVPVTGPEAAMSAAATSPDAAPDNAVDVWPVVDRTTDSVLVTVRRHLGLGLGPVRVVTGVEEVTTTLPDRRGDDTFAPTALLLFHYAIQGFNDLFAEPVPAYQPPRSYIGVTFSDDAAQFSSRPGWPESKTDPDPDGYAFALKAQQAYQVKTHWALNAGLLTLLAHGLEPADFDQLAGQVRTGLVSAANAGFGAHRPPYYRPETNVRELELGAAVIDNLFGAGSYDGVYYADQRLYKATRAEVETYRGLRLSGRLRYFVVDRSTVATFDPASVTGETCLFPPGSRDAGSYVWTEQQTGLLLLPIEDDFRNTLMNPDDDELHRGQLTRDLRRRFMRAVRREPDRPRRCYVYGDDLDHSCGDGWFDGFDPSGNARALKFTRAYLAGMRWIAAHPWVRSWTVDDPEFDVGDHLRTDRELTLSSAVCPSVDPGGAGTLDQFGYPVHFDKWYADWARTEAPWLGTTLEDLSGGLETALVGWPAAYRDNGLYTLAWMYFLAATHESMWSKQPVDPGAEPDPRTYWEPEDFVISESLQQRHAWVYLNASVWGSAPVAAALAGAPDQVHVIARGRPADGGPVRDALRSTHSADPPWQLADPSTSECYWDRDLLDTIVLYNAHVLLVIDRNGGRITNIFNRCGDRAISVSGTLKCHQFLTFGANGAEIACDGQRIQNTVATPNHSYVASDVALAAWTPGTYEDHRVTTTVHDGWYPDNFSEYTCTVEDRGGPVVTCTPAPAVGRATPATDAELTHALYDDRLARERGRPGVVCRDPSTGAAFSKEFRLDGRRITVSYRGVPAGHTVANELCVDLERAVLHAVGQTIDATDPRAVTVGTDAATVTVRLGSGCDFLPAALLDEMPLGQPGQLSEQQRSYSALHRVLTDDLRIVCPTGGAFDYGIELSG